MEPGESDSKLLVVEDSEDLVAVWKILFRESGFNARFASTGSAALAMVEQGYRPDVVITDYYLPDKTGFEVVEGMRERGIEAQCLMITGNKDAAFADAARAKGVHILYKPAKFDDIEAHVHAMARGDGWAGTTP